MKTFFILFLILSIFIVAIVEFNSTGNVVVNNRNPCQIIKCNTPFLGMYKPDVQMANVTADGYAVCKCPWEPPWVKYYVQLKRQ